MNIRIATRSNRRGYSLIEMVVVVGAVTIILSLCGLVLHGMLRLDRTGRGALDDAATIGRLARQFREDVREATTAEVTKAKDKPPGLKVVATDKTIVYQIEGIRLLRIESTLEGKPRRREGFRIDRLGPVTFEVGPPIVNMTLLRTPNSQGNLPRPAIRVVAELGKDRLIARLAENQP